MNWLYRIFNRNRTFGSARSGSWPAFRKRFLAGKVCAVCGGTKKIELHHIKKFQTNPELELSEQNVLPLCENKKYGVVCHLFFGHLGNYRERINPDVILDAMEWNKKLLTK